jgi:hypothetical protein
MSISKLQTALTVSPDMSPTHRIVMTHLEVTRHILNSSEAWLALGLINQFLQVPIRHGAWKARLPSDAIDQCGQMWCNLTHQLNFL